MHENQVLGVVCALLPLPHPGVVSRLGVAALPTGTDVEDGAPGEQVLRSSGWELVLGATRGAWLGIVSHGFVSLTRGPVVPGSAQASGGTDYSFPDLFTQ